MSLVDKIRNILKTFWDNNDYKKFSGNSLGVLLTKLSGVFLAFLVQIPLTRLLGAENYGIYVYVLSWVMIAAVFTRLGMDITFVKYIPTYVTEKKWPSMKGILAFGFGGAVAVCVLLIGIVSAGLYIFDLQTSVFLPFIPVGAALLVVLTISQLTKEALRGLKLVILSEIMEGIIRPFIFLAFFLLFFPLFSEGHAHAALWGNILAALAVTVLLSFHLWRQIPAPVKTAKPDFSDRPAWLSLALPMILMAGMGLLLSRTDIIMLGTIAGTADAGIYAIGSRLADLTTVGLLAANTILAPQISELYHSDQRERLQSLLKISAWFVFAFTFCVALVLTILGPFLLSLFGEAFGAAYVPMLILLVGQMVNALAGPIGFLMLMTGYQKQTAKMLFLAVLLNIVGNAVLVPYYGMNGAAISTGFSVAFVIVTLFIWIVKNMQLNPSILPIKIRK